MARVLYIEDDVSDQKLIKSLLEKAGHQVTLASDGNGGLAKMQAQGFDLVITDANMPGLTSGFGVAKAIRKNFRPDRMPIILLTGRRERRDVEDAIAAGVSDYIVKPVNPTAFLAKVEAALRTVSRTTDIAEVPLSETAYAQTTLNVTSLSERGLSIRAGQAFRVGAEIELGKEFFTKIGLDITPTLKVKACDALPGGEFRLNVGFHEVGEEGLRALRLWISLNQSRKPA